MNSLFDVLCHGLIVGLHTVSLHSSAGYVTEINEAGPAVERKFKAVTPGIYLRAPSGLTLGAYSNSYGKTSLYAAWTIETDDQRFALTGGAVTGYRRTVKENRSPLLGRPSVIHVEGQSVQPLLVPSVRFGLTDNSAVRLAYVPEPRKGGASVIHLSLEAKF